MDKPEDIALQSSCLSPVAEVVPARLELILSSQASIGMDRNNTETSIMEYMHHATTYISTHYYSLAGRHCVLEVARSMRWLDWRLRFC